MQLTAPIFKLKRQAKQLARANAIPLHAALDRVAMSEGFRSWSHLSASASHSSQTKSLLARLSPGDLMLLGARPGQGKTLLGLDLAANADMVGRVGYFFTLDYHAQDIADRFADLGLAGTSRADAVIVDTSDTISADHIIARLDQQAKSALVVIDYLQLLDQRRTHPSLENQITRIQRYADETGLICVVISQIDRSFDHSGRQMPELSDVRLPNPLDLSLFTHTCFLHEGAIRLSSAA